MYRANDKRYENMSYRRCGQSGLKLPAISLGLWQNFGSVNIYENSRAMIHTAFDAGITHFDLANNYGPEPGSAESNFGRILAQDLKSYRDELIISSKAGYLMWPGTKCWVPTPKPWAVSSTPTTFIPSNWLPPFSCWRWWLRLP